MSAFKEAFHLYRRNFSTVLSRSIVSFLLFFLLYTLAVFFILMLAALVIFPVYFFVLTESGDILAEAAMYASVVLAFVLFAPVLLGIHQSFNNVAWRGKTPLRIKNAYKGKHRIRNTICAGLYFAAIFAVYMFYRQPDQNVFSILYDWGSLSHIFDPLASLTGENLFETFARPWQTALVLVPFLLLSTVFSMTPFILADEEAKEASVNPFANSVKILRGHYLKLFLFRVFIILLYIFVFVGGLYFFSFLSERYGEAVFALLLLWFAAIFAVSVFVIGPWYVMVHGVLYGRLREKALKEG